MKTNNRILSIDSLRLVASLLVVSIHCWIYTGRDIVVPYARIAVPLFFLISGYFLFSNDTQDSCQRINRSLKKIGWIWVVGTLVFCVDCLYKCNLRGDFSLFEPTWQTPFLWIVFCHQKIGFPLWFLVAMAEGLVAMKLQIRNSWEQHLPNIWQWIVPGALLTIGVLLNKYLCHFYPIMGNKDLQYPPVVFMSFPYLFLGYCIRKEQTSIVSFFQNKQTLLGFAILLVALATYVEASLVPTGGDSYLCTLPLAILIFILSLLFPSAGGKKQAKIGRKYSLWIYVFHVIVYSCLQRTLGTYNHWLLHPIIIFTITLIFSWFIDISISRIKNDSKIIKSIFS